MWATGKAYTDTKALLKHSSTSIWRVIVKVVEVTLLLVYTRDKSYFNKQTAQTLGQARQHIKASNRQNASNSKEVHNWECFPLADFCSRELSRTTPGTTRLTQTLPENAVGVKFALDVTMYNWDQQASVKRIKWMWGEALHSTMQSLSSLWSIVCIRLIQDKRQTVHFNIKCTC